MGTSGGGGRELHLQNGQVRIVIGPEGGSVLRPALQELDLQEGVNHLPSGCRLTLHRKSASQNPLSQTTLAQTSLSQKNHLSQTPLSQTPHSQKPLSPLSSRGVSSALVGGVGCQGG